LLPFQGGGFCCRFKRAAFVALSSDPRSRARLGASLEAHLEKAAIPRGPPT
jgi:hypothetical protein